MASVQVRISPSAHRALRELSERTHQPMPQLLEQAVEELRRRLFFEEVNAAFGRLKADPAAWAEEQEERRLWEATLADGMERCIPSRS